MIIKGALLLWFLMAARVARAGYGTGSANIFSTGTSWAETSTCAGNLDAPKFTPRAANEATYDWYMTTTSAGGGRRLPLANIGFENVLGGTSALCPTRQMLLLS